MRTFPRIEYPLLWFDISKRATQHYGGNVYVVLLYRIVYRRRREASTMNIPRFSGKYRAIRTCVYESRYREHEFPVGLREGIYCNDLRYGEEITVGKFVVRLGRAIVPGGGEIRNRTIGRSAWGPVANSSGQGND